MPLHVVTGPPAAGKSTYIKQHRKDGDITIDYDTLANALSGLEPDNHTHTQAVKHVTKAARDAAITAATKHADDIDIWIIHSTPSQATLDSYTEQGANIIVVDPGKEVVMKRIKTQRPKHMHAVAARWYDNQHAPKPRKLKSTTERGYGHRHMKQRERLLRRMTDGEACQWCGKPMFKDKTKNFDHAALEADHSEPLLDNNSRGNIADRLLHRTCNRQRGAGREHLSPMHKPVNKPNGISTNGVNNIHESDLGKHAGQGAAKVIFEW